MNRTIRVILCCLIGVLLVISAISVSGQILVRHWDNEQDRLSRALMRYHGTDRIRMKYDGERLICYIFRKKKWIKVGCDPYSTGRR